MSVTFCNVNITFPNISFTRAFEKNHCYVQKVVQQALDPIYPTNPYTLKREIVFQPAWAQPYVEK